MFDHEKGSCKHLEVIDILGTERSLTAVKVKHRAVQNKAKFADLSPGKVIIMIELKKLDSSPWDHSPVVK